MKFMLLFITSLLSLSMASNPDDPTNPDLITKLRQAPSLLAQNQLITASNGWVYNFSANAHYSLDPGSVCNAHTTTFAAMTGLPMTVAQLNLGPCAMLPPHLHRSNNAVVSVTGTTHTFMVQENGAETVETELSPGLMTIFPAASIHYMVNEGCGTNLLYSFLSGEDPGTLNVANTIQQLGVDISGHVLGLDTSNLKTYSVGNGSIPGYDACLKKCGLTSSAGGQGGYVRIV